MRHLRLVLACGSATLAKAIGESDKVLGVPGDDERPRAVVQADGDGGRFTSCSDEAVDFSDLLLELGELKAGHGEHGARDAFAVLDRRRGEGGAEGEGREDEGALEADLEEDGETMEGLLVEGLPRVGSGGGSGGRGRVVPCDDAGRDDSLRVSSRTLESGSEFLGPEVRTLAVNDVLGELGESDEGEGDGARGEVGDGGASSRVGEPEEGIEGVGVQLGRVLCGGEGGEVGRGEREERGEKGRVEVVEGLKAPNKSAWTPNPTRRRKRTWSSSK